MLIELNNISKTYKTGSIEVRALKNVTVAVEKGDFISIMGPSGSGKSTLMNILGCLDRATEGEYILEGIRVSELSDNRLAIIRNRKIGFVFQSFNLLSRMTALENAELPLIYAGVNRRKRRSMAMEALEKVGLKDRIRHKPNELSGGEKQRVAIARALVNDPSVILADEPTGNLDSISGEEIMQVFQNLNRLGATIILVTHEREISEHTNSVIEFYDGFLVNKRIIEKPLKAEEMLEIKRKSVNLRGN